MSGFKSEAELQALIEEAIQNETLAQLVVDEAALLDAASSEGKGRFPHFSLDRLCRRATIMAGAAVLESLDSLKLLRANKNVSMTQYETLRPDVVCFNPEKESVVLFELKVSSAAGRQAITELAAYEQEIKNYLPLMSESDVQLVLVSSEWSPLMDHSVSSAITWGGKRILCLQAEKVQDKLVLKTRIPQAWQITGSAQFPPAALVTMTLCLYDYTSANKNAEIDPRLITALKIMGRTGDALGSHGFAILWRDHWDNSMTAFNVTVCCVAPFGLYQESRLSGVIALTEDSFADALDNLVRETCPVGQSKSFFAIGKSAFPLLEELYSPEWEGVSCWANEREQLVSRAEPLMCEFWGSLGLYAIDYVSSPTMRRYRPNLLLGNLGDWSDPRVAIPLIDQLSAPRMMASGNVRWMDSFQLGFYLGLDRSLRKNIQANTNVGVLRCRLFWNAIDVRCALDEVELLSNSATNVHPPEPAFVVHDDPQVEDEDEFNRLVEWIIAEFLMKESGHVHAFICGLEGAPLFDVHGLKPFITEELHQSLVAGIDERMRGATAFVLQSLFTQAQEGSLLPSAKTLLERLLVKLNLSAANADADLTNTPADALLSAWPTCLEASDFVACGVPHRRRAADLSMVDWDWLKQGVMEAHQRGDTSVGVILKANGDVGTGTIEPGGLKLRLRKCDPTLEVMFFDETAMFGSIRIVSWSELKSTKNHASFGTKPSQDAEDL